MQLMLHNAARKFLCALSSGSPRGCSGKNLLRSHPSDSDNVTVTVTVCDTPCDLCQAVIPAAEATRVDFSTHESCSILLPEQGLCTLHWR